MDKSEIEIKILDYMESYKNTMGYIFIEMKFKDEISKKIINEVFNEACTLGYVNQINGGNVQEYYLTDLGKVHLKELKKEKSKRECNESIGKIKIYLEIGAIVGGLIFGGFSIWSTLQNDEIKSSLNSMSKNIKQLQDSLKIKK